MFRPGADVPPSPLVTLLLVWEGKVIAVWSGTSLLVHLLHVWLH